MALLFFLRTIRSIFNHTQGRRSIMPEGVVKWFNEKKGTGSSKKMTVRTFFVHYSAIKGKRIHNRWRKATRSRY